MGEDFQNYDFSSIYILPSHISNIFNMCISYAIDMT